jgi:hypothetical protein
LIRDEGTDNTALVLALLEGGGLNRRLLGYAFGLAAFHPSKVLAARAAKLVDRYANIETHMQLQRLRNGKSELSNEAEYVGKFSQAAFDVFDFMLAYKMILWHRAGINRSHNFQQAHQRLDLTMYTGTALTEGIATLDFVRYLSLPANKEFDIDASMHLLLALPLEMVLIENVRLERFPTALLALPRLRTLSIKRGTHRPRKPMEVPEGGPWSSTSLEKLIIDGMPTLGEAHLGPFPALREAQITRCGLGSIDFLRTSRKLERLTLRYNALQCVPDFLSDCTELRSLDLSGNPFRNIALHLERLPKLEELDIKLQWPRT